MDTNDLRARIDTIFIVMMENRSFDHLLGHMSLPQFGAAPVDGIRAIGDPSLANPSGNGTLISPFLGADGALPNDVPHERSEVATQIAWSAVAGAYAMNGFVRSYEVFSGTTGVLKPPCMSLLTPPDLPMTRFLADNYGVCDRWFAPIPTSTHPNRLMSLCGYTRVDATRSELLPDHDTIFDWLDRHGVRWRVYSAGLPFLTLMPKMWPHLITDRFRRLADLSFDVVHEHDATWPQVVLIEPDYNDSPVHLSGHANDNHPPLAMVFGEAFLRQVYEAVTSHTARWLRSVLFYTYDEHGGFFDHVAPPKIRFAPPADADSRFNAPMESTGVRVPAIVVSPMAASADPARNLLFDHTSILQLLAQRFGPAGADFSPSVGARRVAGIASAAELLDAATARPIAAAPTAAFSGVASLVTSSTPTSGNQLAFVAGIEGFAKVHQQAALKKFPEIAHWLAS